MSKFGEAAGSIIAGILTVALVAVIVSQRSQTGSVITAGGNALSGVINAAVSPITGGSTSGLVAGTAIANLFAGGL